MAVSDEVVLVVMLTGLNLLTLYRKNNLMADLMFFIIGMGTFMLIDTTYAWIGLLIALIGLMSFIYDAFGKTQIRVPK